MNYDKTSNGIFRQAMIIEIRVFTAAAVIIINMGKCVIKVPLLEGYNTLQIDFIVGLLQPSPLQAHIIPFSTLPLTVKLLSTQSMKKGISPLSSPNHLQTLSFLNHYTLLIILRSEQYNVFRCLLIASIFFLSISIVCSPYSTSEQSIITCLHFTVGWLLVA